MRQKGKRQKGKKQGEKQGERKAGGGEEAHRKGKRQRCSTTVTVWKRVERQTGRDHEKMTAQNTME
jgi:hypothetical protein